MRRQLTRFLIAAVLIVGPAAGVARAITVDDLVGLKTNGLSDELLVAVIQTDGSVFRLSPSELIAARKRGLSDTVLLAMVLTAQNSAAASEPVRTVEAINSTSQETAPTVIHVHQTIVQEVTQPSAVTFFVPVAVPTVTGHANVDRRVEPAPVYWGFNGARRADSWVPASETRLKADAPKPPADKPPSGRTDTKKP